MYQFFELIEQFRYQNRFFYKIFTYDAYWAFFTNRLFWRNDIQELQTLGRNSLPQKAPFLSGWSSQNDTVDELWISMARRPGTRFPEHLLEWKEVLSSRLAEKLPVENFLSRGCSGKQMTRTQIGTGVNGSQVYTSWLSKWNSL